MSIFNDKQKYWVLGACAGVLVLAGGLCAILLSGKDTKLPPSLPEEKAVPPATVASRSQENIVVGTPEVDLVAEQRKHEIETVIIRNTMLPGTIIYGVDVSGMSREEAQAAVAEKLAQEPLTINLLLSDGTNVYPASGEGIRTIAAATVFLWRKRRTTTP